MENIKNRFWCRKNSSKQLILLILLFVSLLLMIFAFLFRSILFTKDNTRHIWEEDISVEYVFPLGIYQEQIYMEYGFEGVDYLSYQRSNMNVPIYQSNNESGVLFRSQGDNDWVIDDSLGIRDRVDLYVENNSQYVMDLGYSHCRDFELVF